MLSQVGSASSQTYKKKISLTSHLPGDLDMPTPLVWVHLQPSEKKKKHIPLQKSIQGPNYWTKKIIPETF